MKYKEVFLSADELDLPPYAIYVKEVGWFDNSDCCHRGYLFLVPDEGEKLLSDMHNDAED